MSVCAGCPKLDEVALPTDPNTRAWFGIEPQFLEYPDLGPPPLIDPVTLELFDPTEGRE